MLPGGGHPISPGGGHPCPTLTHLAESPPSFARGSALAESAGEPCCGASLSPQPRPHCQGARGPSWEQHRAAAPVPSAGLPAGFGIRTQEHLDASEQVTTGSSRLPGCARPQGLSTPPWKHSPGLRVPAREAWKTPPSRLHSVLRQDCVNSQGGARSRDQDGHQLQVEAMPQTEDAWD